MGVAPVGVRKLRFYPSPQVKPTEEGLIYPFKELVLVLKSDFHLLKKLVFFVSMKVLKQ